MESGHLPGREYQGRPWGHFERFTHGEHSTVKIIFVRAGESLSLQSHVKRDEFWRILDGQGVVTIDDAVLHARKDDEFFIPRTAKHRIEASADQDLRFLEISFGEFDENDIVRYEDKYNRN